VQQLRQRHAAGDLGQPISGAPNDSRPAPFRSVLRSEAELRALVPPPPPERISVLKEIPWLDDHARAWIDRSRLAFVATTDHEGRCDVSPRGGPPGWVRVLDEQRLALPDAPGNRRVDTFRNVVLNPRCGLVFLVPGRSEVLRVNGRAWATTDPEALEGIPGKPVLALGVEVDEVFLHCSKALIRSSLWDAPAVDDLPSGAEILRAHLALNGRTVSGEEAERQVTESIRERIW